MNDLILRSELKKSIDNHFVENFKWDQKLTVCEFLTVIYDLIEAEHCEFICEYIKTYNRNETPEWTVDEHEIEKALLREINNKWIDSNTRWSEDLEEIFCEYLKKWGIEE